MGNVASSPNGLAGRFYGQKLTVKPPKGIQQWTAEFNRWMNSLPPTTMRGGKLKATFETIYPKSMSELLDLLRYERKSVEIELRHADGLQATDKARLEGTTRAVRLAAVVYHDGVLWLNHFAGREVVQPRAFREKLADEVDVEILFKLIDVVEEHCSPVVDADRRRKLVDAIQVARVSSPVNPSATPLKTGSVADAWPPDDGWHFREGEAAYVLKSFPIKGIPWKLLRMLATANSPVPQNTLLGCLGENVEISSLRPQLTLLRKSLRKAFGLKGKCDPIPNQDRGALAAWKLDSEKLLPTTQIQR